MTKPTNMRNFKRINVAFSPDNHDYIKTMAFIRGQTMTGFINELIRQHRDANKDLYEKAKALKEQN